MPQSAKLEPTGPTAQQKRDMAATARAEGILRIPDTPYVVLSFDGPVDLGRLRGGIDTFPRPGDQIGPSVIVGGEMKAYNTAPDSAVIGMQSAIATQAQLLGEADVDDEPGDVEEEAAPDTEALILTHLREHGPGSPQDIAAATGLTRMATTVELVRLNNAGRVTKNGLAYGLIG